MVASTAKVIASLHAGGRTRRCSRFGRSSVKRMMPRFGSSTRQRTRRPAMPVATDGAQPGAPFDSRSHARKRSNVSGPGGDEEDENPDRPVIETHSRQCLLRLARSFVREACIDGKDGYVCLFLGLLQRQSILPAACVAGLGLLSDCGDTWSRPRDRASRCRALIGTRTRSSAAGLDRRGGPGAFRADEQGQLRSNEDGTRTRRAL